MKMTKTKTYQAIHYLYSVGWSEEDQAFIARVTEFPSLATHGDTMEETLEQIKEVVTFVLKDLEKSGEEIPKPLSVRKFSGKLNVRLPESLHRQLVIEADRQGVSLNQMINLKLAK